MADKTPLTFDQAVAQFDPDGIQAAEHAAEAERLETLERYPLEHWGEMTLGEYALGQPDHPENYCRWLERQTVEMGSIRGGSARKLIIYKHATKPGWYFPTEFADENAAWASVREEFVQALALAGAGKWEEIEQIAVLSRGKALLVKTLWVYFPTDLLPINSTANLRHFLKVVGRDEEAGNSELGPIQLNRALLTTLREDPKLATMTTKALERFLYGYFSPFEGRLVKIAPGEQAKYWEDCRDGGFICVGWDEVGDLTQYASKGDYRTAFQDAFGSMYAPSKLTEKANELWLLMDIAVGERIVANQGTSHVLAVGTVQAPGYVFDDAREEFKHTIRVDWDESFAAEIPPQKRWAFKTISVLNSKVSAVVLGGDTEGAGSTATTGEGEDGDLRFAEIAEVLERRGQAVLYGPPGTGKTHAARGFAEWFAEQQSTKGAATTAGVSGARAWCVVANPREWSWETLFESGEQLFRRGRVQANYKRIRAGDLVFGYTTRPKTRFECLCRVRRLEESEGGPTFVLEPLARIADGPTLHEVQADPLLAGSQFVANRFQGTLFAMTSEEALRLADLVAERDPQAATVVQEALAGADADDPVEWITFHPSYSYEDFVEGFRPTPGDGTTGPGLRLEDGIFKRMCARAEEHPDVDYLLVIDEINRANIAKVFGELITLIEKDKRGAVSTRLPYSKATFTIPPNLLLLGTMNTADRSIKLLDTALRRRFGFVEFMPEPELLEGAVVGGLSLDELLQKLNAIVIQEAGREKQIGHSYFLDAGKPLTDEDEFTRMFRTELVPLLQEYALDDYDVLALFLGEQIVDVDQRTIDRDRLTDPGQLLDALETHLFAAKDATV